MERLWNYTLIFNEWALRMIEEGYEIVSWNSNECSELYKNIQDRPSYRVMNEMTLMKWKITNK